MFENEILKMKCVQQFLVMEAPRCSVGVMAGKNSVILELLTRVRTRLDSTRKPKTGDTSHSHKQAEVLRFSEVFTEFAAAATPIRQTNPRFRSIIQAVVISDKSRRSGTGARKRKKKKVDEEDTGDG